MEHLRAVLDEKFATYNCKEFIKDDPVSFPHSFSNLHILATGKRVGKRDRVVLDKLLAVVRCKLFVKYRSQMFHIQLYSQGLKHCHCLLQFAVCVVTCRDERQT